MWGLASTCSLVLSTKACSSPLDLLFQSEFQQFVPSLYHARLIHSTSRYVSRYSSDVRSPFWSNLGVLFA